MQRIIIPGAVLSLIALGALFASDQESYAWTRGQPPAPAALLEQAKTRYQTTREERLDYRAETIELADQVIETLQGVVNGLEEGKNVSAGLEQAVRLSQDLEGKLSVGSRVAQGELAGQLRAFSKQASAGGQIDLNAFTLYTARVVYFFQRELPMPHPSVTTIDL